jgi:hypothetical protein
MNVADFGLAMRVCLFCVCVCFVCVSVLCVCLFCVFAASIKVISVKQKLQSKKLWQFIIISLCVFVVGLGRDPLAHMRGVG